MPKLYPDDACSRGFLKQKMTELPLIVHSLSSYVQLASTVTDPVKLEMKSYVNPGFSILFYITSKLSVQHFIKPLYGLYNIAHVIWISSY